MLHTPPSNMTNSSSSSHTSSSSRSSQCCSFLPGRSLTAPVNGGLHLLRVQQQQQRQRQVVGAPWLQQWCNQEAELLLEAAKGSGVAAAAEAAPVVRLVAVGLGLLWHSR